MSSRVTSEKWISTLSEEEERKVSSSHEGRLILHDVRPLFQPVWNSCTNIISVFGRARQGKSFLMNCLSGEKSLFKVSNYKESCTQGIDLSSKFMNLSDFSRVDGGRGGVSNEVKVGFVDAEGQGDKDIAYDANLICPILLASKCVIFNWKGDLQKDHILSTLGIMTRAAKNVSAEGGSDGKGPGEGKKKFGHLHIVFRDWQAVGSDSTSVFDILFSAEKGHDATSRNQIREEVRQAFESISVWLFEAPTDSVQALRQVLTIDVTTPRFRQQIRDFRQALSQQLSAPVLFANRPLTGKTICSMMTDVIHTLNRGEVILPASTYLTMMREEVRHLSSAFSEEVKRVVGRAVEVVDRERRHVIHLPDNDKRTLSVYLNTADARQVFRSLAETEVKASLNQVLEVIGLPNAPAPAPAPTRSSSTPTATPYETLYRETADKMWREVEEAQKNFDLTYHQHFVQYLRQTRQRLEAEIAAEARALLATPPLSQCSSEKECREFLQATLLTRFLNEVNPSQYYTNTAASSSTAATEQIADVVEALTRFSQPQQQECLKAFEKALKHRKEELDRVFKGVCQSMTESIPSILLSLATEHTRGFSQSSLFSRLDEQYQTLDAQLQRQLAHILSPKAQKSVVAEYVAMFLEHCATLREESIKEYNAMKEKRLFDEFEAAEALLNQELSILADKWEEEWKVFRAQLEEDPETVAHKQLIDLSQMRLTFDQLLTRIWKEAIGGVIGWLSDTIPANQLTNETFLRQTNFGGKLLHYLTDSVQPFFQELVKVVQQIEKERQTALKDLETQRLRKEQAEEEDEEDDDEDYHDNQTVPMDEDQEDLSFNEEEEGEAGEAEDAADRALSKMKKTIGLTVAEQRSRARVFAESVLGISFEKSGKKKKSPAKKAATASSSASKGGKKSLQQQREAAREFAAKAFGSAVLTESDDEQEEEERENLRGNSSAANAKKKRGHEDLTTSGKSTATSTPAKTAPTSAEKRKAPPSAGKKEGTEDLVAAARRAAQEEQARREQEAIEKATQRINQQKKLKASKK